MGLDESKLAHSHRPVEHKYKICHSSPIVPWQIIHQCSPDLWKKYHREYFNFPDKPMACSYHIPNECTQTFCLSIQSIISCRRSSSVFSLRKRKKCFKVAEHFEYNHIPARLSSIQNLHFKSILATRNGLAVVYLARDLITQFAIVDLRINKFLGSFGRQSVTFNPELTIGKISPDGGWCLIKLPFIRDKRMSVLKLYDLRTCELLTELLLSPVPRPLSHLTSSSPDRSPLSPYQGDNRLPSPSAPSTQPTLSFPLAGENRQLIMANQSAPVLFAFDPRFLHTRIAITNLSFVGPDAGDEHDTVYGSKASVSLIRLPTWEHIATTTSFKCPSVFNRTSPTGVSRPSGGASHCGAFGGVVGAVTSTRMLSRRRRASETNHGSDMSPLSGTVVPSPHILSIFYSRDGYLLFVVSTEHRVCRCSTVGHHVSTSLLPSLFSADSSEVIGGTTHVLSNEIPEESGFSTITYAVTSRTETTPRPPLAAPAMPKCTTLWLTIFDSDSLTRLRTLRFDRPICPLHTCPTNYVPVMSRCGSRLVLITNQYVGFQQPSTHPTRSTHSPHACSPGDRRVNPTALRHSVPLVNLDTCGRDTRTPDATLVGTSYHRSDTLNIGNIDTSRSLASLSPSLPPTATTEIKRPPMSNVLSSSSSPLPRLAMPPTDSPRTHAGRGCCSTSHQQSLHTTTTTVADLPPINIAVSSVSMRQAEVLLVYQLPPPPCLQALTRQKIRQIVQENMLDQLDLPPRLIDYLRFQPTFSCAGSCLSRSNSVSTLTRSDTCDFTI